MNNTDLERTILSKLPSGWDIRIYGGDFFFGVLKSSLTNEEWVVTAFDSEDGISLSITGSSSKALDLDILSIIKELATRDNRK